MTKRIPHRLLISAIMIAFLGISPILAQDADQQLAAARTQLRAGQYDAALAGIHRALVEHPADARLHTLQGLAYSLKGEYARALLSFQAALRIDPQFTPALKAEAQILTKEQSPEAAAVLLRILEIDPEDNTAREMLALEQARAGDCNAAITNFQSLATTLDTHPNSLLRYGACLFSTAKFAEAVTVYARAAQVQPTNPEILYDLALSQVDAGQNSAALNTLAPLLLGAPDLDTLTLGSDAAEAAGDTPRSVALLRQAIVLDPRLAESYVRFAELCMLHQSYQAGIEMLNAGLARLPQSSSLYLARGMLYGGQGDYGKAEADFHSAELFDPKHGLGSYGVGLVQSQANHPEQALATTRLALRDHPDDAQLNFLLARLLIESGEKPGSTSFEEALRAAAKAVRLSPDFLPARNLLAKIDLMMGDPAHAAEQCRAALKIDPTDETATYRLLLVSRQIGDADTVKELSARVAEQHQRARDEEGKRLRFRIVGADSSTGAALPDDASKALP